MGWRIIKQPNGQYARFSEVVDDFTHMDMTRAEALDYCREHLGRLDAEAKVRRADDNEGERWPEAIAVIREVHGYSQSAVRDHEGITIKKLASEL